MIGKRVEYSNGGPLVGKVIYIYQGIKYLGSGEYLPVTKAIIFIETFEDLQHIEISAITKILEENV